MTVAQNLAAIRDRIDAARAEASGQTVCLVAVSKRQPLERLAEAYAAGHRDFGENYIQALVDKRAQYPDARWHAIGHVQRNKAKGAVSASLIHTLDSARLARALDRVADGPIQVLIEVNIDQEDAKAGVAPDAVEALLDEVRSIPAIRVQGLMCIPQAGAGRSAFARLRSLRDAVSRKSGLALTELSMGMSADFEDAIREGATIVRVGTAIFGPREA